MYEIHCLPEVSREGVTNSLGATDRKMTSVALITSMASTLPNFRGPLVKAMVSRGLKVYALAPDYDDEIWAATLECGAEPLRISMDRTGTRPLRDLLDTYRLSRLLRRLEVDLVFSYFAKPVVFGSVAAKIAGVPNRYALVAGLGFVFTESDQRLSLARKALRLMLVLMYRIGFRACRRVFFQNSEDIEYFVQRRALSRAKACRTNGTGVDIDYFHVEPPNIKPVTFLLMSRLLREKGIREFVSAARHVKSRYPDTRFIVLGATDPNPGGFTSTEIDELFQDGIVEWLGYARDVRPWISQASVYVLPSYREGVPRSTQEAMAMGRPVITTDAVGCRETVEAGINGFLVPVRDSDALALAMIRFVQQPALIESMGKESRRIAEERFNVDEINERILSIMRLD